MKCNSGIGSYTTIEDLCGFIPQIKNDVAGRRTHTRVILDSAGELIQGNDVPVGADVKLRLIFQVSLEDERLLWEEVNERVRRVGPPAEERECALCVENTGLQLKCCNNPMCKLYPTRSRV